MTGRTQQFIIDTKNANDDSTLQFFLEPLLELAENLRLSIARYPSVNIGVEEASVGELISVGTSPQYDIDRIKRREYAREQGFIPVLDIVTDYTKIKKRLLNYALNLNSSQELYCGGNVTFHRGFIKVDSDQGSVIIKNSEIGEIFKNAVLNHFINR